MGEADVVAELTPEARAIGTPRGMALVLADGREWILAAYLPYLNGVWDTLYDHNVLRGRYRAADVLTAAERLLRVNYELTDREAFGLLHGADLNALKHAAELALFGPARQHRKWSDWAETSLLANGIDPASLPPHRLLDVLEMLERSGRVVSAAEWISSQDAMSRRKKLLEAFKGG